MDKKNKFTRQVEFVKKGKVLAVRAQGPELRLQALTR